MYLPRLLVMLACISSAVSSNQQWVPLGADGPQDEGPIRVLTSDRSGLDLELRLDGMYVEERSEMGTTYQRFSLPSGGHTADLGLPEIPYFGRLVAVPHGASVEVEFAPTDSVELPGFTVWPAQTPPTDDGQKPAFVKDEEFYRNGASFPSKHAMISDAGVIRGCEVALVGIFPVHWDPSRSTLRIYTRARVGVRFSGGTGRFVEDRLRSRFFEPLFRQTLLNYDAIGGFDPLPRVREGEGELLIIAADALYSAVTPLAEWRTAEGLPAVVVTRTAAGSTAEGIRQYIEDAYQQWETPPSFVLLVGDAETLPTNYLYMHPIQFNMTAADLWYFTVDGTDYFADMHYGRISVDNTSQLNQILSKFSSYEKTPQTGPWNNHAFLASYQEDGLYFHITSNQIYTYLNAIGYDVDRAYENGTPPGDTQDVIDNFNAGCFLVNHRDHGGREDWVHPSFWTYDFPQVNNGQMMPMVFSINCLSGYFDSETDQTQGTFESFSEELLRKSPGGAIGILSSSRSSYSGYNDEFNKGLIDAMWPGFDTGYPGSTQNPWESPTYQPGAVLNYAKWYMYDKYVLTDGAGYPDGYPWGPTPEQTRLQMEMYHCHGDPTLDIHTAQPTAMVVSHGATIPVGTESFDVTVSTESALVAVSQDGALVGRASVSGGVAHVVFDPLPGQGTLDVVVTAHNRIPHESEASVVSASGWFVNIASVAAQDVAGYVNGAIEQGDSVALTVTLQNIGSMAAPSVTGTLSTTDVGVDIAVGSQTYGAIGPGASSSGTGPYLVKIHGGVDDGVVVPFTLQVTAGESLWVHSFSLAIHAPLLQVGQVLVDDAAGNGNGYAEPGETVSLWVSLTNSGTGAASSVQGELACSDAAVTINTPAVPYPVITPGAVEISSAPFSVTLSATCALGSIPFTETVTCFGPDGTQLTFAIIVGAVPVLVVDADDESTEERLLEAMDQLDHQYRVWRPYLQGTVPPDTLALYRAVVWTGGDNSNSSATADDQEGLAQYLSGGGSLLFSAENYLTAYGDASFAANFLHVEEHETGIDANAVAGVDGDPITDDFDTWLDYPAGLSTTPDGLTPDPEATAILTTSGMWQKTVAIRYPATGQGTHRVIFMTVPFEALPPGGAQPDNPETFLDRALAWLMAGTDVTPPQSITSLSLIPGTESSAVLTWQPVWDNTGVDHYAVHRGVVAYFLATSSTLLGTTTSTTWTDPTGLGDPDVDHYYLVIAVDTAANESAPSNRVGEHENVLEP